MKAQGDAGNEVADRLPQVLGFCLCVLCSPGPRNVFTSGQVASASGCCSSEGEQILPDPPLLALLRQLDIGSIQFLKDRHSFL